MPSLPAESPEIALVLLDLDGTIIGPDGGVSAAVWQAIESARAAGITLATCTGRPCQGTARDIAHRLGSQTPHIFHNGALISTANGTVLQAETLEPEVLIALAMHARSIGATLEFYTASATYAEDLSPRCLHHAEVLGIEVTQKDLLEVARTQQVLRAHWIVAPEKIEAALAFHPAGTQIGAATSPALPESVFASVTTTGITKGSAARLVAQMLDIPLAQTMAIGDSGSDIPALEVVGHPRVIGCAPTEMTAIFPTLPSLEQDGVVAALEEACQSRLS